MKSFYVILLSIFLFSCSNDDDNSAQETGLQGTWNLVNVTGGIAGIDEDIERGMVVWDFDMTSGMVTITNTIADSTFDTSLPSGTYSYSVSAPADDDVLIVNEVSLGIINIAGSAFTVGQSSGISEDGLVFLFQR